MIEHLIKLAAKLEVEGKTDLADKVKCIIASDGKDLKGELSAKELMGLLPEPARKQFVNQLIDSLDFKLNFDAGEQGTTVNAVPSIKDGETDGMPLGYTSALPGIEKFMDVEKDEPVLEGADTPDDIDKAFSDVTHITEKERQQKEDQERKVQQDKDVEEQFYRDNPDQVPGGPFEWKRRSPQEVRQMSPFDKEEMHDIRKDLTFPTKEVDEAVQGLEPKAELIARLVKIADRLDQEGKFELAAKADATIRQLHSEINIKVDGTVGMTDQNPSNPLIVEGARPKAPLKSLKDDVKKNLVLFIIDADKNLSKGVGGLKELFRRLRYFDIDDTVKDLGLDKVVKEMEKTQSCLDEAKKNFYTITFGKRPSEDDLGGLLKSLTDKDDDGDAADDALAFFDAQADDGDNAEDKDEAEDCCGDQVEDDDVEDDGDDAEDMLSEFWAYDGGEE